MRDELAAERCRLPWVPVTMEYAFDRPQGRVGLAPYQKLAEYRRRMGWWFPWYSSAPGDFNLDYHVSFDPGQDDAEYDYAPLGSPPDELPGMSVFARDEAGQVYLAAAARPVSRGVSGTDPACSPPAAGR